MDTSWVLTAKAKRETSKGDDGTPAYKHTVKQTPNRTHTRIHHHTNTCIRHQLRPQHRQLDSTRIHTRHRTHLDNHQRRCTISHARYKTNQITNPHKGHKTSQARKEGYKTRNNPHKTNPRHKTSRSTINTQGHKTRQAHSVSHQTRPSRRHERHTPATQTASSNTRSRFRVQTRKHHQTSQAGS